MSGTARRVQLEPAYLLHHYAWRDSSRILEFMTRSQGRVSVFARAARRGGTTLPATLQPFGELLVSWTSRGEAGQLTGAERVRAPAVLAGDRLMSAFYANELLIRLLPRHDPHPELFDAYATLLDQLHDGDAQPARALRLFDGASLLSLAREDLGDERSLADARRLLRAALDQCLDGRPLRTREVLVAMRAHGGGTDGG